MVYVLPHKESHEARFSCVLALIRQGVAAPERSRNGLFCVLGRRFGKWSAPLMLERQTESERSRTSQPAANLSSPLHLSAVPSQSGDRHSIRGCHRPHSRKTERRRFSQQRESGACRGPGCTAKPAKHRTKSIRVMLGAFGPTREGYPLSVKRSDFRCDFSLYQA